MELDVSELSVSDRLEWFDLDRKRFALESRCLGEPWVFDRVRGKYCWTGIVRHEEKGRSVPAQKVRLIYPTGFPARFIEARLEPDPPKELWGALLSHVNADGSVCYTTASEWTPQDTASDVVRLLTTWWWNYYWVKESEGQLHWPERGKLEI